MRRFRLNAEDQRGAASSELSLLIAVCCVMLLATLTSVSATLDSEFIQAAKAMGGGSLGTEEKPPVSCSGTSC